MSKVAVEHLFRGETVEYPAYDPTKTRLGKLISQFNLGALDDQKYAGPLPVVVGRPMEASTAIPCTYPCTVDIGDGQQYVFLADNAAAAATRRVVMFKYDKNLGTFSWQGYITITFPTATNFTIRGFRMVRYTNSTGTVGVSGTAVTGSGTNWKTAGMAAGSRIGFGSTDPAQITTWYQIAPGSAIASDKLRIAQQIAPAVPVTVQQATFARVEGALEVPVAVPTGAVPGKKGPLGGIEVGLSAKLSTPPPGLRRIRRSPLSRPPTAAGSSCSGAETAMAAMPACR